MGQLQGFALLGKCHCGAEDSIYLIGSTSQWSSRAIETEMVECVRCLSRWENVRQLCSRRATDEHIVPIYIERLQHEVRLPFTRRETDVPCAKLINDTLYHALARLFCLTRQDENGSILVGEKIHIIDTNFRALSTQDGDKDLRQPELRLLVYGDVNICQSVIDIYLQFLYALLTEELIVDEDSYGKGQVVKLSSNETMYLEKIQCLLWLVIKLKQGSEFANAVLDNSGFALPTLSTILSLQIVQVF